MATISWTTGAAGAWSSASNWSPAQVPGSGDDALIAGSGTYQVTVAGATVHSVTLDDPGATLLSAGMVTIEDRLNLNAGTLVVATGMLIAAGSLANAAPSSIFRRCFCSVRMPTPACRGSAAPVRCSWAIR
jgi:hypothetical protein